MTNITYLGNHAERLKSLDQLEEGEMYVVGRGDKHFQGFIMPNPSHIEGNYPTLFRIKDIPVYEADVKNCRTELERAEVEDNSSVELDNEVDIEWMDWVFRPTQGSRLRKTVAEAFENHFVEKSEMTPASQ